MFNIVTRQPLSHHRYAQCGVYDFGNKLEFESYNTTVIIAEKQDDGTWYVYCTGTYSPTTRKQIGWFLKEFFGELNYYDMKQSAATGEVFTGVKRQCAKFW